MKMAMTVEKAWTKVWAVEMTWTTGVKQTDSILRTQYVQSADSSGLLFEACQSFRAGVTGARDPPEDERELLGFIEVFLDDQSAPAPHLKIQLHRDFPRVFGVVFNVSNRHCRLRWGQVTTSDEAVWVLHFESTTPVSSRPSSLVTLRQGLARRDSESLRLVWSCWEMICCPYFTVRTVRQRGKGPKYPYDELIRALATKRCLISGIHGRKGSHSFAVSQIAEHKLLNRKAICQKTTRILSQVSDL
ncbi:hypothetical protein F5144DRAFT_104898 [Chaetomium tenue]|uniref:Uncharacterized protein n=1 Tax=Chaetomium tenue TaxID=1854479 RepID=A0ACB7PIT4_9PEZI|nr:hypothetical protein F5144DRAFT_104898 [Chaetomium globosum]